MKTDWKKYLYLSSSVFVLYLAVHYWETVASAAGVALKAAMPLLTGCVIAYILNILMTFYEKHYFPNNQKESVRKSARPVCMIGAYLTLLVIVALVIGLAVPVLVSCVKILWVGVPEAIDALTNLLSKWNYMPGDILKSLEEIDWEQALDGILKVLSSGIGNTFNFAAGAFSSIVSKGTNLVIGSVFAAYLLLGKERLKSQCDRLMKRYLRPAWNRNVRYVASVTNRCFRNFIVGQCTEAMILGMLCTVGMLIFRFPYAFMTGVVVGVTALIPIVGAFLGGAVGFFLILSESPMQAFLFLIYLIVLQQLEDKLIYPKVVGASLGLPGMWVMATVTVGGGMFGISGMLIGLPVAATVYQLLKNDVNKIC